MDHLIQIIGISFHLAESLNIQKIHIKSITAWPIDLLHTNDNVCLNLKRCRYSIFNPRKKKELAPSNSTIMLGLMVCA